MRRRRMNALLYSRKSEVSAKDDLPDFWPQSGFFIRDEANTHILGRFLHDLAEVPEGLHRGKTVWLQDELGLKILDAVERRAVCVCRAIAGRGCD